MPAAPCENPFLKPTLFVDPLAKFTRTANNKLIDLVDWQGCFSSLVPYNEIRYNDPIIPKWAYHGHAIVLNGDPTEACSRLSGLNVQLKRWTIAWYFDLPQWRFVFVFESSDDAVLVMMVL